MTRRESRELAFILCFERTFSDESVDAIVEVAGEARDIRVSEFALSLAKGVEQQQAALDQTIAAFSHNWNVNRLSRVALCVLRVALYEMRFVEEIPVSVSINEAVELAKTYGGEEDASFVNGVLGGVARSGQETAGGTVPPEPDGETAGPNQPASV